MLLLAYVFVVLAVALRLLPHPFHFTPVAASLLFFGAFASRKQMWIPVALLAASDYYLTVYHYGYSFSWDYAVTFAWYAAMVLLGGVLLKRQVSAPRVVGGALAASVSFFLLSNGMVWAVSNMYPKNAGGLMMSYAAGVPFFRTTLVSDLFFTAVAFGTPYVIAAVERTFTSHNHTAAA
jgi:hypothetical protein